MAYPIIKGQNSSLALSSSSRVVTFTNYAVGDLLVISLTSENNYSYVGNGWTSTLQVVNNSTIKSYLIYKIADGDDVILLNGGKYSYFATTIGGSIGLVRASQQNTATNVISSPYLNTGSSKEYMWLLIASTWGGRTDGPPIGYGNYNRVGNSYYTSICYNTNTSIDNQQADWASSLSPTNVWAGWTLAIKPIPSKITIGVQNSKIASLTGNITKNNLIIKE